MKHYIVFAFSALVLAGCQTSRKEGPAATLRKIEPVDFSHVRIDDRFWSPRLEKHVSATLPVCIDQIENQTGRIRNFERAAAGSGEHSGIFFDDSDVYKALEGIAYSLINRPDVELEKKADEWIDKFAAAQQPDGYLNTFYTLTAPEKRWTNMDKHEMYCAGHMMEAGVAYYQATGKRKLLDVCIGMADHMLSVFGPGKRHWVPGHEEIELALVKLSNVTGDTRYLDFAHWLLEERGHGHGTKGGEGEWSTAYYQDEIPVGRLTDISGHAVRCMYLYAGMADVAALTHDTAYMAALGRLWKDVVFRNMYITGGIGSSRDNEGFTEDYDLPNYEAYCETCASVGMVFWNARMNQLSGDAKYIDVLERSMYNGALAGISLAGDRFFYVNPLASKGDHHRQAWYGCACCPSQLSRFLPSIGNYIYGRSDDGIWVNLYIGNEARIPAGCDTLTLAQQTGYPWNGDIELTIKEAKRALAMKLRLRIPDWCKQYMLAVNGEAIEGAPVEQGYATIDRTWQAGDRVTLRLAMPVEVVAADARVKENVGKRAIRRGPLVYCLEEVDNPASFRQSALSPETTFEATFHPDLLGGVVAIEATAPEGAQASRPFTLIPYYAWDSRAPGEMQVWIPYYE